MEISYVVQSSINQYRVLTDYTHVVLLSETGSTSATGRFHPYRISNIVWFMYILMNWCGVITLYSNLAGANVLETLSFGVILYQNIASWPWSSSHSSGTSLLCHSLMARTHITAKGELPTHLKNCLTCSVVVCENLPCQTSLKKYHFQLANDAWGVLLKQWKSGGAKVSQSEEMFALVIGDNPYLLHPRCYSHLINYVAILQRNGL